jgi:hypothetical protein
MRNIRIMLKKSRMRLLFAGGAENTSLEDNTLLQTIP